MKQLKLKLRSKIQTFIIKYNNEFKKENILYYLLMVLSEEKGNVKS